MKHWVLIGFMGSGKSTLAPILSKKFSLPIFCTDDEIEKQTNMSIGEIFGHFGEEFFRHKENELFLQIKHLDSPHIIDCGGGFGAYQNVNELGRVIFLDVAFEEIVRRLRADEERFNQNKNSKERKEMPIKRPLFDSMLKSRFDARFEIYQKKADIVINHLMDSDEVIRRIESLNKEAISKKS